MGRGGIVDALLNTPFILVPSVLTTSSPIVFDMPMASKLISCSFLTKKKKKKRLEVILGTPEMPTEGNPRALLLGQSSKHI